MAPRPRPVPTQRVLTQGIADLSTRNAVDQLSRRIAQVEGDAKTKIANLEKINADLTDKFSTHDAAISKLKTNLAWTTQLAVAALPPDSKTPFPIGPPPGGGGTPPGTSPPGGTDMGQGAAGFDAAFPSGTAPPGTARTPFTAGQIVGGVAKQFFANYFAGPAGNQAILDSWRACFNNRCIYHLNQAGFQTSHYPGGAGAVYLILINIPDDNNPNNQYAYQITNYDPTLTLTAQMLFVGTIGVGTSTAPDPGIPDGTPCP